MLNSINNSNPQDINITTYQNSWHKLNNYFRWWICGFFRWISLLKWWRWSESYEGETNREGSERKIQ